LKLSETKFKSFDIKEYQTWSDLTGEKYYIQDNEYIPITLIRSHALIETRNCLCKHLSKKQFINALWYLSKYSTSPDILDLASDFEYNEIVKWIDYAETNSIAKLNLSLDNELNILNKNI